MIGTGLIDLLTWVFGLFIPGVLVMSLSFPRVSHWSYHPTQVYLAARDGLLGQLRLQMETLANRVGTDKR